VRIERISNIMDFGEYVLDQSAHILMVLAVVAPVLWWGPWAIPLSGLFRLAPREYEQWRRKSEVSKMADRMLPPVTRHLDRVLDVVWGSVGATAVWMTARWVC